MFFAHGVDPTLKGRRLGRVSFKEDEEGVWVQGQLDLHDTWLTKIYELVKQGILGFSTGAVSHLVERMERTGPAGKVFELMRWPVGEVSLTSSPAAPWGTEAVPLKSFELQQTPLEELYRVSQLGEVALLREKSMSLLSPIAPSAWGESQRLRRANHGTVVEDRREARLSAKAVRKELQKVLGLKREYEQLLAFQQNASRVTGYWPYANRSAAPEMRATKEGRTFSAANLAEMQKIHDAIGKVKEGLQGAHDDLASLIDRGMLRDSPGTSE